MTKFKENLIALVWAVCLTWIVIFVLNHNLNLSTDILGNENTITADLSVVAGSGYVAIKSNKTIDNIASITMELAFNPQKIKLSDKQIVSDYDIGIQKINPGNYYIMLTNVNMVKSGDTIIKLKGISKKQLVNINFGHIQVVDNNWNILTLTLSK